MKVHLDISHSASSKNRSGIVRVEQELIRYLKLNFHVKDYCLVDFLNQDTQLQKPNKSDLYIFAGPLWRYEYQEKIQWLKNNGAKIGIFIYDLLPILQPSFHGEIALKFKDHINLCLNVSDHLIFINDYTKEQFLNFFPSRNLNPRKIVLGGLGVSQDDLFPDESTVELTDIPERYILYVSAFHPRKNHEVLLEAYEHLIKRNVGDIAPSLVMAGGAIIEGESILRRINTSPASNKFISLKRCSDKKLNDLYSNALFTVYPSFFEGWGMPITESLNMGKIVICSNDSSMDAACQDLCIRASPYESQIWADHIYNLSINPNERLKWEKKIAAKYKNRTWEDIFTKLFESILN